MGNYRRKLDIIADILHVASGNAKKTQIMYQANLSYKVLQKYLSEVIGASLVMFYEEEQNYRLTNKGWEFLENYAEYSKTNKNVAKRLNDILRKKKVLDELCSNK